MEEVKAMRWASLAEDTLATVSPRTGLSIYVSKEAVVKNASSALRLNCLDFSQTQPGLLACGSELGQLILFEDGIKRNTLHAHSHRSLRFVCWDPAGEGKLAVGFQGVRGEPGLSVLDAVQTGESPRTSVERYNLSISEGAVDGSFLRPRVLAVGLQSRYLRLHDFRTPDHISSMQTVAHPWGPVQGVRVHLGDYIATFGATAVTNNSNLLGSTPPLAMTGSSTAGGGTGTSGGAGSSSGTNGVTGGASGASTGNSDLESSSSSCIRIWDVRRFDKPVCSISASKGHFPTSLVQIEWDPCRRHVLHFVTGSESAVRSICCVPAGATSSRSQSGSGNDSPSPAESVEEGFYHMMSRPTPHPVQAFALKHGTGSMAIATPPQRIEFLETRRPCLMRLDKSDQIVELKAAGNGDNPKNLGETTTRTKGLQKQIEAPEKELSKLRSWHGVEDICGLAKAGYGTDPVANARLSQGSKRRVWEWVARGGLKSFVDVCASSPPSRKSYYVFPSFISPNRAQTLRLCGWGGDAKETKSTEDWQNLVALLILDARDVKRAVSVLTSRPEWMRDTLCLAVATALAGWPGSMALDDIATSSSATATQNSTSAAAGNPSAVQPVVVISSKPSASPITGEQQQVPVRPPSRLALEDEDEDERVSRAQVWCRSVSELEKRLNPLLRAAFSLMIACTNPITARKPEELVQTVARLLSNESILKLIVEDSAVTGSDAEIPKLTLTDRLAIGSAYASDEALKTFIEREAARSAEAGDLEGLLLTGLYGTSRSAQGWRILEKAVDMNGEFQTVALLNGLAMSSGPHHDSEFVPHHWLELYRDFLDEVGMFHARARLDVSLSRQRGAAVGKGPEETVHVHCSKCGANMLGQRREQSGGPGQPQQQKQRNARLCYNCSRTLPVCSVCRSPVEVPNPLTHRRHNVQDHAGNKSSLHKNDEFRSWLGWCLECKHGGHVGCINDWFHLRRSCPVASCACTKCGREGT